MMSLCCLEVGLGVLGLFSAGDLKRSGVPDLQAHEDRKPGSWAKSGRGAEKPTAPKITSETICVCSRIWSHPKFPARIA